MSRGANRKTPHSRQRRVTFVLADAEHKLILISSMMQVRLKKAEHDSNVYEGPILGTWRRLPINLRKLEYVGVLMSDTSKEYQHRIQWLEESDPSAARPSPDGANLQWVKDARASDDSARDPSPDRPSPTPAG